MRLAKLKLFEREGLHESHPGEIDGLLQVSDDSWEMTGVGLGFPERGVNEIAGIQQFGGRTDGFLGASEGTVSAEAVLEGNRLAL